MIDRRHVDELSPLELFEAALEGLDRFGWTAGRWNLELFVEDGHVRQLRARPPVPHGAATVGRRQLDELGSAA